MHPASFPWISLLLLGAVHGINPAMGWLFAVGRGLQERDRRAVWRALGPLALGHALAVGAAVALALTLGTVLPPRALRWGVAVALLLVGVDGLVRHRHVQLAGMRVGARELATWSFLMASAHGAGLMVLPFVLGAAASMPVQPHHHHMMAAGVATTDSLGVAAPLVHTLGYLVATVVIAIVVYEKVGLRILRRAWINLNALWAGALIAAAVAALV
ncbi:hypothetical protein J421_5152 (plasmid) [Gemmatirosa kalamazoonensis]|uniref:Uncharacterized protein n=1 Tax=Gemmatirosa kalamazoonensis TaxID=861299 RepID=W0RQF9_9BACT|nr:hypothetical protein [Gemmatirosa kalamazoonensis]AHG92687.1 hypothetical protein J421_5152 [Gemmatirosa kalamazoonensis]